MPKMKTNKAVKKRFKLTGTGKLMYSRAGRRHILTKKTSKRKRQLSKQGVLFIKPTIRTYKRMMCAE